MDECLRCFLALAAAAVACGVIDEVEVGSDDARGTVATGIEAAFRGVGKGGAAVCRLRAECADGDLGRATGSGPPFEREFALELDCLVEEETPPSVLAEEEGSPATGIPEGENSREMGRDDPPVLATVVA